MRRCVRWLLNARCQAGLAEVGIDLRSDRTTLGLNLRERGEFHYPSTQLMQEATQKGGQLPCARECSRKLGSLGRNWIERRQPIRLAVHDSDGLGEVRDRLIGRGWLRKLVQSCELCRADRVARGDVLGRPRRRASATPK
jgi:hypothetical protein